jgi:hypothetical protein
MRAAVAVGICSSRFRYGLAPVPPHHRDEAPGGHVVVRHCFGLRLAVDTTVETLDYAALAGANVDDLPVAGCCLPHHDLMHDAA